MLILDTVKMLKLSRPFKLQCEAAAMQAKMSWSAWARMAMQKQIDRQHEHRQE